MSDTDAQAKERAKEKLRSQANGQRVLARDCYNPRTETKEIAVAVQTAVRLEQLLAHADRVFDRFDGLESIADTEATKES